MKKLNEMAKRLGAIKERLESTIDIDDFGDTMMNIFEETDLLFFESEAEMYFFKQEVSNVVNKEIFDRFGIEQNNKIHYSLV